MENASKAIMIAGAVLITMLVVSLIVIFLGNASSITSTFAEEITGAKVENHNNKYLKYEGRVRGIEVINAATSVLEELKMKDPLDISMKYYNIVLDKSNKKNYDSIINNVDKYKVYTVSLKYDKNSGLINRIVVGD